MKDVLASYAAHANAFVTKPLDIDELMVALLHIGEFYGRLVQLSRHASTT